MFKNRYFGYLCAILLLSGCAGTDTTPSSTDWFDGYDATTVGTPSVLYGRPSDGYGAPTPDDTHAKQIAVALPLSGQNSEIGNTIRTSVEAAVLQHAPHGLTVSFYDTNSDASETFREILSGNPGVIIGPVFSNEAQIIKSSKPETLPVLSFTSDATALGDGVMTLNLMPTNSIETIIREMRHDNRAQFIVMAPDTASGHLMAGTAKNAAKIYNMPLVGIFFYEPGNPESIKNTSATASMHNARATAHTRARQVLSDILINERLTVLEKSNLNLQLEKLSKTETLGRIPYDAILFLGNGDDTKSLASYLRYYDVGSRDASFYGTTMWDDSDIAHDITMSGAKFATLPAISPEFSVIYQQLSGTLPNRLATFGYDAANMAIGTLYSDKSNASYLLDPSGYIGTDGLFRIKPTGESERALRIVTLDGSGTPRENKPAPTDFTKPLYNIEQRHITPTAAMDLETPGIDPDDYIVIPERLREKYRSKTIGTNITVAPLVQKSEIVAILPEDDSASIKSQNFTPLKLETISRSYIDEYEIIED